MTAIQPQRPTPPTTQEIDLGRKKWRLRHTVIASSGWLSFPLSLGLLCAGINNQPYMDRPYMAVVTGFLLAVGAATVLLAAIEDDPYAALSNSECLLMLDLCKTLGAGQVYREVVLAQGRQFIRLDLKNLQAFKAQRDAWTLSADYRAAYVALYKTEASRNDQSVSGLD